MRCAVNKCTSFNHYPTENKCCLAHGNPAYGAKFTNPHNITGHITYVGTVQWNTGDVMYKGKGWEMGDESTKDLEF